MNIQKNFYLFLINKINLELKKNSKYVIIKYELRLKKIIEQLYEQGLFLSYEIALGVSSLVYILYLNPKCNGFFSKLLLKPFSSKKIYNLKSKQICFKTQELGTTLFTNNILQMTSTTALLRKGLGGIPVLKIK